MVKPNFSPVGTYSMEPFALPNAAAGRSQRHTAGSAPVGQRVREAAVLLRWYDSADDEPTALMKGI